MPFRIVFALCIVFLSACTPRSAPPRVEVPRVEVPIEAEPLPPEIKPLTMEQEEQVAG
ncbi:hypothetical protein MesoLjLb_00600 [Mesorhizobium sp. L-8-3]|nr:hypothetical protein MesoLjLb_00600 [Mesorhizobium sp. L-8-3]